MANEPKDNSAEEFAASFGFAEQMKKADAERFRGWYGRGCLLLDQDLSCKSVLESPQGVGTGGTAEESETLAA